MNILLLSIVSFIMVSPYCSDAAELCSEGICNWEKLELTENSEEMTKFFNHGLQFYESFSGNHGVQSTVTKKERSSNPKAYRFEVTIVPKQCDANGRCQFDPEVKFMDFSSNSYNFSLYRSQRVQYCKIQVIQDSNGRFQTEFGCKPKPKMFTLTSGKNQSEWKYLSKVWDLEDRQRGVSSVKNSEKTWSFCTSLW